MINTTIVHHFHSMRSRSTTPHFFIVRSFAWHGTTKSLSLKDTISCMDVFTNGWNWLNTVLDFLQRERETVFCQQCVFKSDPTVNDTITGHCDLVINRTTFLIWCVATGEQIYPNTGINTYNCLIRLK